MNARVLIYVPTYLGKICIGLADALTKWMGTGFVYDIQFSARRTPVSHSLNWTYKDAMKTPDWTHCLIVNDDITPGPHALEQLLEADVDAIAPMIYTIKDVHGVSIPSRLNFLRGPRVEKSPKGVTECNFLPGGMYLCTRKVYESVGPSPYKDVFDKDGIMIRGSDEFFSSLVIDQGFKIYAHCDVTVEHEMSIGSYHFSNMVRGK